MGEETKIEWCDHSWSPWRGCTKVSPGCAHCYAETLSKRNPAVLGQWGKGKPRVLAKNWNEPVRWNRDHQLNVDASHDGMYDGAASVLRVKRPTVFPSLCDWLDDEVDLDWLARFLQLIHDTPNLTWLLLTKRPENWEKRVIAGALRLRRTNASAACYWREWAHAEGMFPRNVWVGTSVEDQTRANERIPALLRIPAVGRFLSVEPLLGPVDLEHVVIKKSDAPERGKPDVSFDSLRGWHGGFTRPEKTRINWVIIGGESGPGARRCNVDWIRSLVRQCRDASVPCFVKQLGAWPVYTAAGGFTPEQSQAAVKAHWTDPGWFIDWNSDHNRSPKITHPKGGDPEEWPEDLRVREFPEGLR